MIENRSVITKKHTNIAVDVFAEIKKEPGYSPNSFRSAMSTRSLNVMPLRLDSA